MSGQFDMFCTGSMLGEMKYTLRMRFYENYCYIKLMFFKAIVRCDGNVEKIIKFDYGAL